jgi:monoterpene epsilon-lactone hydrolase
MDSPALKFQISSTVSDEAAAQMKSFYDKDPSLVKGDPPKTQADWDRMSAAADAGKKPQSDAYAEKIGVSVERDTLGGVPIIRIRPPGLAADTGRVLIYIHGGGYVVYSASAELVLPTLIATELDIEVVSIDYTLAPRSDYETTTDQVLSVYNAIVDSGIQASSIAMSGDSAGGGITLASVLKMRDRGLPLPAALYLQSPNTDVSDAGDSRMTLGDADPIIAISAVQEMRSAYVPDGQFKNPHASPVYGDYTRAFPPTLIQGGTREVLLSDFVRLYQAMAQGGNEAVLDLYEGMCHVFQARFPEVPETRAAISRAGSFIRSKLD